MNRFLALPPRALGKKTSAGHALLNITRIRRVLRTITAPILSSLSRIVPTCARANSVPSRATRRIVSISA